MKLTVKIALVFTCVFSAILLIRGYVRVDERLASIERNWQSDQELLAQALAPAISRSWRLEGREAALYTMSYLDQYQERRSVRWVQWDDSGTKAEQPAVAAAKLALDSAIPIRSFVEADKDGKRHLYTYALLSQEESDAVPGAVELKTRLPNEHDLWLLVLEDELQFILVYGGIAAILVSMLGGWWVGRPASRLIAQADAVGSGDLDARAEVKQKDEFGLLADAMNRMTSRLAEAKAKVKSEEEARAAALAQLRHVERVATVGQLAAGVAHEIGTPLNVIQGRATLIVEDESTHEGARSDARIIVSQVRRITQIIRSLLDFGRQRDPEKTVFDLSDLAREVVLLLAISAKDKGLSLTSTECEDGVLVYGDRGQIQQVVTNLVVNAIQATETGEIRVGSKRAEPDENHVSLWVADTGPGIAPEVRSKLFDPFFTTKDVGKGTGLGLSVSYGIIKEHDGEIHVVSEKDSGTRFTVRLPAAKPQTS